VIPRLDWRQLAAEPEVFAGALGQVCRSAGFFLLNGHGINPALIERVFERPGAFFALPQAVKAPLAIERNAHNRGWAGAEARDEASGQRDRKEAFSVGLDLAPNDPRVLRGEPFRGVNLWPDLPGFRETMLANYDAALALGRGLIGAVARDFGLPPNRFDAEVSAPMATLRLLHYQGGGAGIGAGAHTDCGALTLLLTDGAPGLQVRPRGGDWIDPPQAPGNSSSMWGTA
jgi:isopenicillin N synthase-like dioxygenase